MSFDLSVIIPTYKRKESLTLLVEKLSRQKNINIEVIIVDQNPGSFWTAEELKNFEGLKHVRQSQPNASLARNNGFQVSTAPYVLFMDDDLEPAENFCKAGLDIFIKYRSIECFSPNVYNNQGAEQSLSDAKRKAIKGASISADVFTITDTISAAVFFKRDYFVRTGGFDPLLFEFARTAEDQEFFLRMLKKGLQLWYVNEVSVFHNEKIAGGCELRTMDYWVTRRKCILSWALRYRIHNNPIGSLGVQELYKLSRSCFLNKTAVSGGINSLQRNITMMFSAIRESKSFYQKNKGSYLSQGNGFLEHLI